MELPTAYIVSVNSVATSGLEAFSARPDAPVVDNHAAHAVHLRQAVAAGLRRAASAIAPRAGTAGTYETA